MPELRRKKCEESLDFIIVFLIFAISILLIKDAKNLMMSLLIMIKNWITGLGLWDKIVGGIMSFVTGGALKKFCNKFKSTEEEKAFKRAVKRWNSSFYIRGYYKKNKVKTINEFCEYVIGHHGVYDDDIDTLYRLFEEELQKTHEGREFLQSIRIKLLNKDQYDSLMKTNDILNEQKKLHEMLAEIKQELCTHNKGIREFTVVDGYIQRYCTLRLKSDEYFKYYWEHKGIKRYKLADIVAGRTDCKGRKFVLYSDAQTGKTTELLRLGWELQEEGRLVPIMFKVRGNQSIKQELPALRPDIEKGLVVIVDALDEKFDGDARFGLYHEIETYAEEHPQLRIVMTCRENFSSEYKFEGFTELNLNDLTWQDSEDYLVSKNLGNIVDEIKKRKLYEFVRTPFYLIAMADYYNEKKTLPDNKGELYEYFIDRRLAQEEKLSLKQNTEMLTTGKLLLQKMAVAMQLMGINHIAKNDLLNLFDYQYDDYNRVQRSGLIEPGEDDSYGFTHNSFKEYFVARYLLNLSDFEEIRRVCCYSGTKIVRTGWYNTVALLLAQLPKTSALCKQILAWIVEDNKELVLYIDRKLLTIEERTVIFKDIIEWHKSKNLRFADIGTSRYEDLMMFGKSEDSIDYLMSELEVCNEIDCHAVNVLFLLRYVRQEDLSLEKAGVLRKRILNIFEMFKEDDEHIYIFFEVLRNPWLQTEETVDEVYDILKDSDHPNIVDHFVEFVVEAGCAEKYADVIIEKGQYIKNYNKDGYNRILGKDNLYNAYLAMTTWNSIKKALSQLKTEFVQHLVSSTDEEKFEEIVGKLLEKASKMIIDNPEIPDFVYEMLLDMAEDRFSARKVEKDAFIKFFDCTGLSQHYFEETANTLKDYFLYNKIEVKTYEEHRQMESKAYCAALLLNEERLDELADAIDYSNPNGDSMLSCISQFASEKMQAEIDTIRRNRYSQYWRDKNALALWQIESQREYDELMDYERFKGKILKILEEKAPKNKADMKELRHAKMNFTDEDEKSISHYMSRIFYEYYNEKDDSYDLEGIKDFVEDYSNYQKMVVQFTEEFLYSNNNRTKMNDKQKELFKNSVVAWMEELANGPYMINYSHKHPAITVLLHHDVNVDDDLLLRLLPYSSSSIYIQGNGFGGRNYSLFDYISERCGGQTTFLTALRECMDRPTEYADRNWQEWCVYLVKQGATSEYQRTIDMMLSLPCASPSLRIAEVLLENEETRPMVLKNDVLTRCDMEKKLYIFERLALDATMDDFVREGVEKDFDNMDDGNKNRAARILLMKGSIKGLEYAEQNPSVLRIRADVRNYAIEALPLLMSVYSKAMEKEHQSDYSGILKAVEVIAEDTDEGWEKVNQLFERLIQQDSKKFQHLNWYLRDWMVKRMEKASPVMSLEKVKEMLAA